MPDLTFHTAWTCETNEDWQVQVQSNRKGHSGSFYNVSYSRLFGPRRTTEFGYQCTCTGFRVRGTCKHVQSFEAQDKDGSPESNPGQARRCGWDSEYNSGGRYEPVVVDGEASCPCCHRPAKPYRFGS